MKKTDFILIGVVIVIIIVGIFAFGVKDTTALEYDLPLDIGEDVGLHELSYSEYIEKVNNGDNFIFIMERTSCSHCQNFMPIVTSFVEKYNIPVYYIDTDTMSEDEFTEFESSNSYLKKNSSSWGTPTTLILVGSTSIADYEGETDEDGFYDFLKDYVTLNETSE